MRVISPGTLVIDQFPAFEDDGYNKRSGLTPADFTASSFKDGTEDPVTITISEIGTTGEYKVEFTPPTEGFWQIQVLIDFNKEIWVSNVTAGESLKSIQDQVDKIDLESTIGPAAVESGSLMDRMMNKNAGKTYNQATDSLEAIKDRTG